MTDLAAAPGAVDADLVAPAKAEGAQAQLDPPMLLEHRGAVVTGWALAVVINNLR
jgi:hypothetical protein